ncbi:hypothetical protein TcBrA4_0121720 [Trypanosoma cruzi]|nr:hypothetical protein TcBrA4_0121720 [Trypanosoma cruzi]
MTPMSRGGTTAVYKLHGRSKCNTRGSGWRLKTLIPVFKTLARYGQPEFSSLMLSPEFASLKPQFFSFVDGSVQSHFRNDISSAPSSRTATDVSMRNLEHRTTLYLDMIA